jgi:phosphohistidine phosphatase
MQILLIRHGIAVDPDSSKSAPNGDAERPLTKQGRQKMRKAARGLRQLVPALDLIATSPLVRAAQTAEIVAREYGDTRTVQVSALAPRKPLPTLLEWLNAHPPEATVALVGHEPHLSMFLCWLLTGLQESFVALRKGGAALVEVPTPVAAGKAKLLWMLKPSQLRNLR